jgi:hypothetical protein
MRWSKKTTKTEQELQEQEVEREREREREETNKETRNSVPFQILLRSIANYSCQTRFVWFFSYVIVLL